MSSPFSADARYALAWRSRSPRGSEPAVASLNSSSADFAFAFRSVGTWTSTVTSRSPVVPSLRRTPFPRTRNVRPLGVPAGMRRLTGMPWCVGTLISAPSAASLKVSGTVSVRLWPLRPNTLCGSTCTRTYRSPAGPPRSPDAPLPAILMRCPSATPAGILAWMVRVLIARPLPEHVGQGSSTTRPRPRQVLHGSENAKLPRLRLPCPVPSHVGQTFGTVPAFAPVPMQTLHGPSPVSRSDTVAPSMASPNDSDVSVSTSAPRRGLACCVVPPRLKTPLNRSPNRPPALPVVPPNKSPRSKPPYPLVPPDPGMRGPPLPNSERASSYSLRRFSSDSTV